MKTNHQQRVEEFMYLAKQELPLTPTIPSEAIRRLRAKLILEEAFETVEALGFEIGNIPVLVANYTIKIHIDGLIKECCDLRVVTTGTLSAFGIPDEPFQKLVDDNNLAKFGPGHTYREDGKLIKPLGFQPPDIAGKLAEIIDKEERKEAVKRQLESVKQDFRDLEDKSILDVVSDLDIRKLQSLKTGLLEVYMNDIQRLEATLRQM